MKISLKIAMVAATVILLSATSLFAQSPKMRVHIPFGFAVGEKHMPAGDYRVSMDLLFHRMTLEQEGGTSIFLYAHRSFRGDVRETGSLTFDKFGDSYFLRKMASPGDATWYEWPESRAEREMAKLGSPAEVTSIQVGTR